MPRSIGFSPLDRTYYLTNGYTLCKDQSRGKFRDNILEGISNFDQSNKNDMLCPCDKGLKALKKKKGALMEPDFQKMGGLVPVVVQDYTSGKVLMLAYLNKEAWELCLKTGEAHYYSRSRKVLWHKGETSGHVQRIKEVLLDCDLDTVLLKVEQVGGACCHDGYASCFYRRISGDGVNIVEERIFDPRKVYGR